MIKKFSLLFLSLCFVLMLSAQNSLNYKTPEIHDAFPVKDKLEGYPIKCINGNTLLACSFMEPHEKGSKKDGRSRLVLLDKDMKVIKRVDLSDLMPPGKYFRYNTYVAGNKLLVLVSEYKKEQKSASYKLYNYDLNDLKLSSNVIDLGTWTFDNGGFLSSMKSGASYNFLISPDKSTFCFYLSKHEGTKKNMSYHRYCKIFTLNNEDIKSYDFPVDERYQDLDQVDYELGNDGSIYVLTAKYHRKKSDPMDHYYIYEISNGNLVKLDDLNIGDHEISEPMMTWEGDRLCVSGFYTNPENYRGVEGTFVYTYDLTNGSHDYSSSAIDAKIFTEGYSDKEQKKLIESINKGKGVNKNIIPRALFIDDDGSKTLVAERQYSYTVTYNNPNGGSSSVTYFVYDKGYVFRFDKDGKLVWQKSIDKWFQTTSPSEAASMSIGQDNKGDLILYYTNNIKNMDGAKNSKKISYAGPAGIKNSVPIIETIDSNGETKLSELKINLEKKDYILADQVLIDCNSVLMPIWDRKHGIVAFAKSGLDDM